MALATTFILISGLFFLVQIDASKKQIDLITFCLFLTITYFGIWPFILLSSSNYNPPSELSTLAINLITFCSYVGLWLINRFLKRIPQARPYKTLVDLDLFIEKVRETPLKYFIYFELFMLGFTFYGYLKFGILKAFDFGDMSSLGISIPIWYLAIFASKRFFVFFLVSALSIKQISGAKSSLVLTLGLLIIFLLSLLYGRASFIMAVSAYLLFYMKLKGKHFLKLKLLFGGMVTLVVLVMALNFFQHVRSSLLSPAVLSQGETAISIFKQRVETLEFSELLELDELGDSLVDRPSVWKFNEMIYSWQFVHPEQARLPFGVLLLNSWMMLIPRTIWKEKPVNNFQKNFLFPFYNETYFAFQAPSVLGYVLADFSLLTPFMFPILMVSFLFLTSQIIRVFYSSSFSFFMVFSGALYNIMSVEANYDSYILILRNSLFFALIFFSFSMLKKLSKR